ncbi:DNA mismatch repair endonuclease MutL [Clostridium estertheticum]|uniref:DNA mismatch repair endonuclease MutL n=1 Tax=Clostridium estertheticum TaxID=238834 RepID=UPI001C7DFDC3|nr:DNA mismatch repair endonuclease MutL [Clostridium estertheticum]MBX4265399.1 DNA mismatch repair endonuclease MutL [Clostridium estertheticum]MBX4269436.1 DNA mismatch repair endonuclease MutL [Clostridium estertheticum]WLC79225.1 DNA mismatch repair endonuclease MutL [Clostridium estertheticum]WLC90248.1 DNA mismatch repair endonuclease MutL [Clostridium estertheticum]
MRINILEVETSNKIAAGEVVERPSSVVKELVENSIDAGAKNITIEILEGGQKNIKVIDDGSGIHVDDIEKAFLPHATSKIKYVEDIYKIHSLGFRGEALPSIASVSRTLLNSRTKESPFGMEISQSSSDVLYIKEVGCNVGTTIEVKDLFFNVPARQKFLKSPQRESALISDILGRLALANNEISFKLSNNDKKVFSTFSSTQPRDTIRYIYGKEVADNITSFEKYNDVMSVHGYIGNALISRGSRNRQSIFVNKRYIKSGLITAAVENAFKSFLTINKFPFFVIFLDIFPEYIDINVHPQKTEIKFQEDKAIFKFVFDAVHTAIGDSLRGNFDVTEDDNKNNDNNEKRNENENNSAKEVEKNTIKKDVYDFNRIIIDEKVKEELEKSVQIPIDFKYKRQNNENEASSFMESSYAHSSLPKVTSNSGSKFASEVQSTSENVKESGNINQETGEITTSNEVSRISKFPELRIIGQFNKTYIIGEAYNELYLIDQHAAHEKVLFEKYKKEIKNAQVVSQILLVPTVIELSVDDYAYYSENVVVFNNTGFNIIEFGENTISIKEVPIILGKPDIKNLFNEILDNLKNMGSGETIQIKYTRIATLACKAAVKANNMLSDLEMSKLINDLRYIDEPFTCPHGRPTIIKITLNELEKKFKRIQ